jgi:hypothetical protein
MAERCAFGDLRSDKLAVLIGDSHAGHYWEFVNALGQDAHVKVYGVMGSECLMLPRRNFSLHGQAQPECEKTTSEVFELIDNKHFSYVLIAQRWIGFDADQLSHLGSAVARIIASGATPVILGPVAEDGTDTKNCFYRHIKLRQPYSDECAIQKDNSFGRPAKNYARLLFEEVRKRHPTTILIDPQQVQCNDSKCATVIDRTPLYDDVHHINGFASNLFAHRYIESIGNPLKPTRKLKSSRR